MVRLHSPMHLTTYFTTHYQEQTFTWVEKKRVLNSIGVNADQFLDMGLLAGCDLIGTFAPATEEGPGGFNFNSMSDESDLVASFPASCVFFHLQMSSR